MRIKEDTQVVVTDVVLDQVAQRLFEEVEKAHNAGQRLPTRYDLMEIAAKEVGLDFAGECLEWMQDSYPQDLANLGYGSQPVQE